MHRQNGKLDPIGGWLQGWVDIGCTPDLDAADRLSVQLVNIAVMLRMLHALTYSAFFLHAWPQLLPSFVIFVTAVGLSPLALYFNHRHRYLLAAVWVNLLLTVPIALNLRLFFGNQAGTQYFFILLSLVPFLTVSRQSRPAAFLLSALNLAALGLVWDQEPFFDARAALDPAMSELRQTVSLIIPSIGLAAALFYYQHQLHRIQDELWQKSIDLKRLLDHAQEQALSDLLTGLPNRRHMDETLTEEVLRATRFGTPFSVIMFDLDHFKRVNDTYGHDAGDRVLHSISHLARANLRGVDLCGRWGGEEFLVLLPNTNLEGALLVAEKIRASLESHQHVGVGTVTGSFGVAEWVAPEEGDALVKRADNAMFRAKSGGRNLVSVSLEGRSDRKPVHLEWNADWETGIDSIDRSHRLILETANQFARSGGPQQPHSEQMALLDLFQTELCAHYADEESMFERIAYPRRKQHAQEHQRLVGRVQAMVERYRHQVIDPAEVYHAIADELVVGHLINLDMDYIYYLDRVGSVR